MCNKHVSKLQAYLTNPGAYSVPLFVISYPYSRSKPSTMCMNRYLRTEEEQHTIALRKQTVVFKPISLGEP
jgi:hypothetical protein